MAIDLKKEIAEEWRNALQHHKKEAKAVDLDSKDMAQILISLIAGALISVFIYTLLTNPDVYGIFFIQLTSSKAINNLLTISFYSFAILTMAFLIVYLGHIAFNLFQTFLAISIVTFAIFLRWSFDKIFFRTKSKKPKNNLKLSQDD